MHRGHLLDWRRELDSAIWQMPPLYYKVWKYLLKRANYKDTRISLRQGGAMFLRRGQFLTTLRSIADGISWYERNRKVVPHPNQIRRILKWMENQGMIDVEQVNLTSSSRQPNEKPGFRNNSTTLITIRNYDLYQSPSRRGRNRGRDTSVTPAEQENELKTNKKEISCGKLESLTELLTSLPEFCGLAKEIQWSITSFLDKVRLANKTESISSKRVRTIINDLIAISGETSAEHLIAALEITVQKADTGQFTFRKHNITGYVRAIAKNRHQQAQKDRNTAYQLVETDMEALYR